MSRRVNYRRYMGDALAPNELRETADTTHLACGHTTQGQPLAVKANGTKLYSCPECGALTKDKLGRHR